MDRPAAACCATQGGAASTRPSPRRDARRSSLAPVLRAASPLCRRRTPKKRDACPQTTSTAWRAK
eukprot:3829694-Prymnesium_polylepis.1